MKTIINVQTGEVTTVPLTAEEIAEREAYERDVLPVEQMAALRRQRDQLLAKTDYLALADATLTDEMRAYRQALRDLPANTTDPANPVWPVKPGSEVAAEEPAAEEPAAEEPVAEEPAAE